jgi:hypothetical protein
MGSISLPKRPGYFPLYVLLNKKNWRVYEKV